MIFNLKRLIVGDSPRAQFRFQLPREWAGIMNKGNAWGIFSLKSCLNSLYEWSYCDVSDEVPGCRKQGNTRHSTQLKKILVLFQRG